MTRFLKLLLAVIGGAIGAWAMMLGFVGALYGMLWIFVFGDDSWPGWVETVLNFTVPVVGLGLWAVFSWAIWNRLNAPSVAG